MITTQRFTLKPLTHKNVNEHYLSWLSTESTSGYINYAKNNDTTLADLIQYVRDREHKKNILFLAIFDKKTNQHIGNIKYEPINFDNKIATMGILIGDKRWRGKGVAGEVILASASYLKERYNINTILLGVDQQNTSALTAYQKIGFSIIEQEKDNIKMHLTLL